MVYAHFHRPSHHHPVRIDLELRLQTVPLPMINLFTPLLRMVRICTPWVLTVVVCLSALGIHEHLHVDAPTVVACDEHDHGDETACDLADCACPAPAALLPEVACLTFKDRGQCLLHAVGDLIPPPNPGICPDPPPAQRT